MKIDKPIKSIVIDLQLARPNVYKISYYENDNSSIVRKSKRIPIEIDKHKKILKMIIGDDYED